VFQNGGNSYRWATRSVCTLLFTTATYHGATRLASTPLLTMLVTAIKITTKLHPMTLTAPCYSTPSINTTTVAALNFTKHDAWAYRAAYKTTFTDTGYGTYGDVNCVAACAALAIYCTGLVKGRLSTKSSHS